MTGSLMQLVTYGVQDLFLTFDPEITFFKFVYKRYTNFAVESIPLQFNNIYDFDKIISCNIPQNGDLISKCYLKVVLPTVAIPKSTSSINTTSETLDLNTYTVKMNEFNNFIDYVYEAIRKINTDIDKDNVTVNDLKTTANNYLTGNSVIYDYATAKNTQTIAVQDRYDILQILTDIDAMDLTQAEKKLLLKRKIKNIDNQAKLHNKGQLDNFISTTTAIVTKNRDQYDFAWVDNIAYKIIEYIEIYIGATRIDQQYGEWLHVWNEINSTTYSKNLIDKLSGNLSDLTTYDSTTKDTHILRIPLKFWFNNNTGLALPLLACRFENIEVVIKTSKLRDCIYTDCTNTSLLKTYVPLNDIELVVDYVFLSDGERKIFTKSRLEYLIEQTNYSTYLLNSSNLEQYIDLDLDHPTKYLVWTTQIQNYLSLYNLHNRYDVFTASKSTSLTKSIYPDITEDTDNINPIGTTIINLNTQNLTPKLNNDYFNYVIPYELFGKTPADGINCYSFSIEPLKYQPSGTCNLTKIDEARLEFKMNSTFLTNAGNSDILVKVHTVNNNVLTFEKGRSKLYF